MNALSESQKFLLWADEINSLIQQKYATRLTACDITMDDLKKHYRKFTPAEFVEHCRLKYNLTEFK